MKSGFLPDEKNLCSLWHQEISATGICVGAAMPMDITDDEQMKDFQDKLDIEAPTVKYLVNAAGLAKIGGPFTLQPEELTHMIDLNCKAAVHMTAICMPHFDKGSRILQICSTAGFNQCRDSMYTLHRKHFYSATVRPLRWELIGKQIYVTAVCPYWIKDTEFIGVAKIPTIQKQPVPYTIFHWLPGQNLWYVLLCWIINSDFGYPLRDRSVLCIDCSVKSCRLS